MKTRKQLQEKIYLELIKETFLKEAGMWDSIKSKFGGNKQPVQQKVQIGFPSNFIRNVLQVLTGEKQVQPNIFEEFQNGLKSEMQKLNSAAQNDQQNANYYKNAITLLNKLFGDVEEFSGRSGSPFDKGYWAQVFQPLEHAYKEIARIQGQINA